MASESSILRPVSSLLDGVWRIFTDLRVTLSLLMLAAAVLVLSILYPSAAPFAGLVLRFTLALLAFCLALRLAMHAERAARLWTGRYAPPEPGLPAETVALEQPVDAAQAHAATVLSASYDRVVSEGAAPSQLLGARRPSGAAGPILAAAGPLVIIMGLLINSTWGLTTQSLVLVEGAALKPISGDLKVGLSAPAPAIAVESSKRETRYYSISPLRPLLVGLYWVLPRGQGPTLQVTADTAAGEKVPLLSLEADATAGSELDLPFRANQAELTFTAPDQGLAFRAVSYPALPERGAGGPVFLLEAYREGDTEPVFSQLVQDQAAVMVGDATFLLRRGQYVSADVAYAPGWPLLALGGLAALIGLLIVFFLPAQEAWIDVYGGARRAEARVQATGGLAPGRAAAELVAALQAPASVSPEGERPS